MIVPLCTAYIIDKLQKNGFIIKYTHPNLLFISWQHYIDKQRRYQFKKIHGYTIDGFGNPIKEKKETDKKTALQIIADPNYLLKNNGNILTKNVRATKTFKPINSYKPTGGLIYNIKLLETNRRWR